MSSSREKVTDSSPIRKSHTASISLVAGALGGVAEVAGFHWLDTIIKRTQNKKGILRVDGESARTSYSKVFFSDAHGQSFKAKFLSLHAGFNFALLYKVGQRTYKFGCQPIVNDFLKTNCGDQFGSLFGNHVTLMTNMAAGSLLGAGEAMVFLPLDMRKIKSILV